MTKTSNFLNELRLVNSPVDGVEVLASTSEQCANVKAYIKGANCKNIRVMYSMLESCGFSINFSRSLFSDNLDKDTFNLWMKPFKALQGKLSAYGICKRINAEEPSDKNKLAENKAKSACFEELKALKKWLGVDEHCKSTDIDTLEAHCFKYVRANREKVVDGWAVKPVTILQFINFLFKELNFGKCKDEIALTTALKFGEQGVLDADNYAEIKKLEQRTDEPEKAEPAKKATKKTTKKAAKVEPAEKVVEVEPTKA